MCLLLGEHPERRPKGLDAGSGKHVQEVKKRFNQGIREFCFYEDNLLLGKNGHSLS